MTGAEGAVVAALIAAGTSVITSEQQMSAARSAESKRADAQRKLSQEQEKREAQSKADEEKNSQLALKKTKAGVKGGRADTILTSPLGVVENEKTAGKSLLGA